MVKILKLRVLTSDFPLSSSMGIWTLWFAAVAALGSAGACVFVNNRLHAYNLPRPLLKAAGLLLDLLTLAGPCAWAAWWWSEGRSLPATDGTSFWRALTPTETPWPVAIPLLACIALGIYFIAAWAARRWWNAPPDALLHEATNEQDVKARVGQSLTSRGVWARVLRLPRNQCMQLDFNAKRLRIDRLPLALEGLRIVHLSDTHFTGRIARAYFDYAVGLANDADANLIALTGDFVDHASCYDWLAETLGRLKAKLGVFFVLGNHDLLVDDARIRRELVDCGLIDLGGRTHELRIGDASLLLAGNELPWFRPAPSVPPRSGSAGTGGQLRLALSHSPDQFRWSRANDFDLLLAGHTHGGQIRPPLIGPIVSPSRHGVKYASGVFHKRPTVMHVSRGLSAKTPLRFGCLPEATVLELTAGGIDEVRE